MMKTKSLSYRSAVYRYLSVAALGMVILVFGQVVFAQPVATIYNPIFPAKPTSSDHIVAVINYFDYCIAVNTKNAYSMRMSQNNIIVTFDKSGTREIIPLFVPPPDGLSALILDIGRLPPGDYTFSTVNSPCESRTRSVLWTSFTNYAFTVTDARPQKPAPWVTQDLSGHWWDPATPGQGVFIHQDAKDNMLGTWFTYDATGKDTWYVFQPRWLGYTTGQFSDVAPIWKASQLTAPGGAAAATQLKPLGTIKLETASIGKITNNSPVPANPQTLEMTVTFTGAAPRVLRLIRFNP